MKTSFGALRVIASLLAAWPAICGTSAGHGQAYRLYVGTYTRGTTSEGIYTFEWDSADGSLRQIDVTQGVENPAFLAIHPTQPLLYAIDEIDDYDGESAGALSAFAIDQPSGRLTLLNRQPTGGTGPCHLAVAPGGRHVLAANYGGGSVAALPLEANGRLQPLSSLVQHRGSSVNPERQSAPHAHCVNWDSTGRFAFVVDLGIDQILQYKFDAETGQLAPNDPPFVKLAAGAGPRRLAFHPDGRRAYVINELDLTLTALEYDAATGRLTVGQSASTVPSGADRAGVSTAEIAIHPSGKFLYGSVRGLDQIAVFEIDSPSGELALVEHESTQGRTPRHFVIDPSGRWLLAENQQSDSIVVFRIDPRSGALTPTDHKAAVPSPVCIVMVEK